MNRTTKLMTVALLSISLLVGSIVTARKKQKLPFVGTKYFNFIGGTGT